MKAQKGRNINGIWQNPEAVLTRLYSYFKQQSRRKSMEWRISKEQFRLMIFAPCFYCGAEPRNSIIGACGKKTTPKHTKAKFYQGIDRIDSTMGYLASNVVPCCPSCNHLKLNQGIGDIICRLSSMLPKLKELHTEASELKSVDVMNPVLVRWLGYHAMTIQSSIAENLHQEGRTLRGSASQMRDMSTLT